MRTEFIGSPWMRFSLKVNQISGVGESIQVIAFIFDIFTATRPYMTRLETEYSPAAVITKLLVM